MNKKAIVLVVLTVVCLAATVGLWFLMNNTEVEFTEVEAKVLSAETRSIKTKGKTTQVHEVTVEYEGESYDLKNVYNSYSYIVGRNTTAYLSNGKLYANEAGIKSTTPVAMVYFAFLFGTFGLLIYTPTYISRCKKLAKENA